MSQMVEKVARAIMVESGCGYTLNGERVLCDDTRLLGEPDGHGKTLYRGDCDCRAEARAAFAEGGIEALVEQAFRDGIAYATNVEVTDIDEAWRTSRIRASLKD